MGQSSSPASVFESEEQDEPSKNCQVIEGLKEFPDNPNLKNSRYTGGLLFQDSCYRHSRTFDDGSFSKVMTSHRYILEVYEVTQ